MARKRYSAEDIIGKLRSAEVWLAEGASSTLPSDGLSPQSTPASFGRVRVR